jgi:biotin carboxyl carrier protein
VGEALSTRYIESVLPELTAGDDEADAGIGGAVISLLKQLQAEAAMLRRAASSEPPGPWDINDSFEFGPPRRIEYDIEAGAARGTVPVVWTASGPEADGGAGTAEAEYIPAGDGVIIWRAMRQTLVRFAARQGGASAGASGDVLRAPMPGRLTRIFVREGDRVASGERLAVVEAMKMEHVLHAGAAGVVKTLARREGDQVDLGAVIVELETGEGHASD